MVRVGWEAVPAILGRAVYTARWPRRHVPTAPEFPNYSALSTPQNATIPDTGTNPLSDVR
jgi:hypothetical protein